MKHAPSVTAVESLKMNGGRHTAANIPGLLRRLAQDKHWSPEDLRTLSSTKAMGEMTRNLFLRGQPTVDAQVYNFLWSTVLDYRPAPGLDRYRGTPAQNKRADGALLSCGVLDTVGIGAGTAWAGFTYNNVLPDEVKRTPICIIGYGAAGIMVAYALRIAGFNNLTVFEKAEPLGIWRQRNVFERSRNNPRRIEYAGAVLSPAPGPGSEVKEFLELLASKISTSVSFVDAEITRIVPGDLDHSVIGKLKSEESKPRIFGTGEKEHKFPIVINCTGLGDPVPLSDSRRMTTNATSTKESGPRWQQTLTREQVQGQKIAFIGLGNSTAEMLRQLHQLMDDIGPSLNADYSILTHYPKDSVFNPNEYVDYGGKRFRVFRDLSQPNLVNYQGDLGKFRNDYYRALTGGKIVSDVKHWDKSYGSSTVVDVSKGKSSTEKSELASSKQFTLIGYKHSRDSIRSMGCTYDDENGCASYDYDGEMVRNHDNSGPARLHRGYFGMGAVLDAPHNPNAIVIPGMVFRIPDMLFGVILRATEVVRKNLGQGYSNYISEYE